MPRIGQSGLAGYEELAPQYNRAVEQARSFQSTLTRDYNRYVQDRQAASTQYQNLLQQRKSAYDQAVAAGAPLRQRVASAKTDLDQLERLISRSAQEATGLYDRYQQQYQAGVKVGQQQYETKLAGFQERGQKLTQDYQRSKAILSYSIARLAFSKGIYQANKVSAIFSQTTQAIAGRFVRIAPIKSIAFLRITEQNRFKGAQEYRVFGSGYYKGYSQPLVAPILDLQVINEAIKFLSRRGTKTFADVL